MTEARRRRVIDPQKTRLYAAEEVLAKHSMSYPEVGDVQRYVDKVLKRKLVREEFRTKRIHVTDGRARRKGGAIVEWHEIRMPRHTRTTYYILHEVAHVLTHDALRHTSHQPHGPEYVGVFLLLVDEFMGVVAGEEFRAKLREHRVDWASWAAPGRHIRPVRSVISSS